MSDNSISCFRINGSGNGYHEKIKCDLNKFYFDLVGFKEQMNLYLYSNLWLIDC